MRAKQIALKQVAEAIWMAIKQTRKIEKEMQELFMAEENPEKARAKFTKKVKATIAKCGIDDVRAYEEFVSTKFHGSEDSMNWELSAFLESPISAKAFKGVLRLFHKYQYLFLMNTEELVAQKIKEMDTLETLIDIGRKAAYAYIRRNGIAPVYVGVDDHDKGMSLYVIAGELVILPTPGIDACKISGKSLRIARDYMATKYHEITVEDVIAITGLVANLIP